MLHNVGASPDASAMLNESDYDYPARESLGDQDPTQTLENDLGDVMFNVEDNNDVHAVQSPRCQKNRSSICAIATIIKNGKFPLI